VQQWSTRVRFRETIEKLYAQGVRTFIEVGPSSNLTSFVSDTLGKKDYLAIASNNQRKSGLEQIQTLLARLFVKNMTLDFSPLYTYREVNKIDWENTEPTDNKMQKAEMILNLTLPIMSFKPEFAQKIRDKISQLKQPFPTSVQTSQSVNLPEQSSIATNFIEPKISTPLTSVPTQIASPQPLSPVINPSSHQSSVGRIHEFSLQNNENSIASVTLPKELHNTVLAGHWQLMQEFLANQARIAEAYFGSCHQTNRETDNSREA
jgi:acyl transferase domain-containing protein